MGANLKKVKENDLENGTRSPNFVCHLMPKSFRRLPSYSQNKMIFCLGTDKFSLEEGTKNISLRETSISKLLKLMYNIIMIIIIIIGVTLLYYCVINTG